MNTPGTMTHWFDVEAENKRGASSQFGMQIFGAVMLVLLFVPGIVFGAADSDMGTGGVVGVAVVATVAFGGFATTIVLVTRSRKRTRAAAGVRRIGVGPTGLLCVSSAGTHNISWDSCHGVRIHSAVRNAWAGKSRTYDLSLDLLGQPPYPPTNPGQAATASPLLSRIALPESAGLHARIAINFAEQIGRAVWGIRPDKWRGFTHNSGFGGDEFQSWDRVFADALGIGPTPTAANFGSRFQPPPPRHPGRPM